MNYFILLFIFFLAPLRGVRAVSYTHLKMTYLKGAIYVSNTAPFIKKNPWDYISSITSQIEGESTIPLSDADIKVFMGGSSDLICRGLSSDEGEFYLRVPSGINCFIEVYMNQKLILIKHLQVSEKREMKVGSLDIESTAEAILLKKKLLINQDQPCLLYTSIIIGEDHRQLLPASLFLGSSVLLWADIFSRTLLHPVELPVGVLTSLMGAPFFIYLLRRKKKGW